MSTINDVAKRAGVSPSTVSRVIQGATNVRPKTREKVELAIEELRYVPSAVAQSLRSKRTRSLALVVPDIANTFWTTVARGVEDTAQRHGYSVLLGNTDEDPAKQRHYLDFLTSQRVDGMIIAPYGSDARHLDKLRQQNVPAVIMDRRVDGWEGDFVCSDSLSGARALVRHLIGLGHERIAMVSGPATTSTAEERVAGYCMALVEAGLPLDPRFIKRGEYRTASGKDLTAQLLDEGLNPTAIFAANNAIAIGVIGAMEERGLRVPQDIALVCFDDFPNVSNIFPFLTVIAQPTYDLGVNAAQLLFSRINSEVDLQPRRVVLPTRLIVRYSCGSRLRDGEQADFSLPIPGSAQIKDRMIKPLNPDEQRELYRSIAGMVAPPPSEEKRLSTYDQSDVNRLLEALQHQEADRLPHLELEVTSRAVYEYVLEHELEQDAENGDLLITPQDHVEFALRLGMDAVACDFSWRPNHIWSDLDNREPPPSLAEQLSLLERYLRAAQGTGVGVIANFSSFFDNALLAAGIAGAPYLFHSNRLLIEKLMDVFLDHQARIMRVVCDRFADDLALIMVSDDVAHDSGLMLDLDLFDDVFSQRMARLIAPAKEHGKLLLAHTRGKLDAVLPILYDLGFDAVHPVEPEYNDIFLLKRQWSGKLAFVGSFPSTLLACGDKDEIEKRVREYCNRLAPGGGYVLGSSDGIDQDVPPENVVAMTRAVHKYGRYGSLGQDHSTRPEDVTTSGRRRLALQQRAAVETKFKIGDRIENRYRVLMAISSGGMGTLYRVADEAHHDGGRDGEIVALKTVKLRGAAEEAEEQMKRFQREFALLTQLRHPNLVSVYNYGITTQGEMYFTMEWIEGADLEPSLHPLEAGATIPAMVQICRALAYLHARGVIHGDLKPSNVLMAADATDQIKLVDFGVAFEIRSPGTRVRYYTPGYAAPETRQPHPIDHRADLYSLGATWYALLVGEPPMFMPGAGKERLIRYSLDETLGKQDQIPAAFGAVIARLMATSPDERYDSANEVIEAVNEIMGSKHALETRETASSYALRTRFVNRAAEIKALRMMWEQAQSERGKLALVSGKAGVGKTRLVEELEIQAELEGARVVWGQCVEEGGSAYRPWREVLRVLTRYVEGADERTMQRVGPILTPLLPELWERDYMAGLAPPAELEPQAAQRRLNDAIAQVLRAAATLRPTMIVIEDAHWADEATLALLRFLAQAPIPEGLLVCVTYRSDEIRSEHPLAALTGDRVQRISLQSLSSEVTTDIVRSMLGLEELPALLIERVQQATEGNAFFVQELIRSLAEHGEVLQRMVGGWQVDTTALQNARLPDSIRQVVWRRLEQLPAETQQALHWAATMGMVFWEEGVAEAGQAARSQVRAALREGLEQGLIAERDESAFVGEREYLFNSSAVREIVYESVSQEERREYHERIATWLAARSNGADEHLGLIAEHLERAGQTERAIIYLGKAGEQAAAQFAHAEALAYLNRALDLVSEEALTERYALLLTREEVYELQGVRELQAQDLATLQELAETLDDDGRRARVALRQTLYGHDTSDYSMAIEAAQSAIRLAQVVQDVSCEAEARSLWGQVLHTQGEYKAARREHEQARNLAHAAGLSKIEAFSLKNLGIVCDMQGDRAESRTYSELALHIFRESGDRLNEAAVLGNLGFLLLGENNYAEAKSFSEQALYINREIGHPLGEAVTLGCLGVAHMDSGEYTDARMYQEQSLRIFDEIGYRRAAADGLGHLGAIFLRCGNYVKARINLEQSQSTLHEVGARREESTMLCRLSLLAHNQGDGHVAEEYSRRALLIVQETNNRVNQALALTTLGYALEGLGRHTESADAYEQALALRRELAQSNLALEPLAGLARVFLSQGNPGQARVHVEEVLRHLDQGHTLDGTEEPFQIYLTCCRVLHINQDPRAPIVLDTAHRLLQERAAGIDDENLRRSFLENVPAHREIVVWFAEGK